MHEEVESETPVKKKKSEVVKRKRKVEKIVIPRRKPSVIVPGRPIIFTTPDKTTCVECPCYPKEDPYMKPKKLNPCQNSPLTLYEYAASAVERLPFPVAFSWSEEEVAEWMGNVGLPEYKESIIDNKINGRRLLMLEDPSHLPEINIRCFQHIQTITSQVRKLFGTDFVRFCRSIGLPPRKPLTHCTWFKSRTGPSWGVRVNWNRYLKPEFPKVKFGRIPKRETREYIPHYKEGPEEPCTETLVPRKFRILKGLTEDQHMIWIDRPVSPPKEKTKKKPVAKVKETNLYPKPVSLEGLKGKDLILARRKMVKPKFLPECK